jgi:hypothetical protein
VEQVILFLILALGWALVNYAARRLHRRAEPQPQPPQAPAVPPRTVRAPERAAVGHDAGLPRTLPRRMPAPPRAPRRHALSVHGRARLREAIVLMIVLGPCRAHDEEDPSAPRRV